MQLPEDGVYTIERQSNILLIDIQGAFNDTVSEQYHQDIKIITEKMSDEPWASLISFQDNSLFTPEAEQKLVETTEYRVDNGMIAIAAVIINSAHADILQMQLQRVYQSCSIQFNFFSDIKPARNWLNSFIN
ncbi:hypothetical protein Q4506_10860 [Colwellia sp. 4_MG-2023]|uniref:hypothetical protein n=1 Tax=unclassified Colwellia TaxID=196834 RepID=UPI001C091688|nr:MULTISPECIES: hypothetical protein [unclassified Colwellia]MBU2925906.1 hypothetical protein [Colwellia sp. C2M11]MDO6488522.1 hypothetical protein [Colwellia sp. 6_MG-2023]MDO6507391.1 hypothetical protein [Colwellia sp. 5_MG-2023]MDO6556189.1 hypothetical protein [Colwellia sp. 4_MG-2023]MDO6652696.1 hypothetical protein [Colwellia sp. 3_MG-2023]